MRQICVLPWLSCTSCTEPVGCPRNWNIFQVWRLFFLSEMYESSFSRFCSDLSGFSAPRLLLENPLGLLRGPAYSRPSWISVIFCFYIKYNDLQDRPPGPILPQSSRPSQAGGETEITNQTKTCRTIYWAQHEGRKGGRFSWIKFSIKKILCMLTIFPVLLLAFLESHWGRP